LLGTKKKTWGKKEQKKKPCECNQLLKKATARGKTVIIGEEATFKKWMGGGRINFI